MRATLFCFLPIPFKVCTVSFPSILHYNVTRKLARNTNTSLIDRWWLDICTKGKLYKKIFLPYNKQCITVIYPFVLSFTLTLIGIENIIEVHPNEKFYSMFSLYAKFKILIEVNRVYLPSSGYMNLARIYKFVFAFLL